MVLAVPLSRFTSQVGGGSAFYVRQQPYANLGVKNKTMKKHIALGTIAATILLTGCSSLHTKSSPCGLAQEFRHQIEASVPVEKWGYKIEEIRFSDDRKKALVVFDATADRRL